MQTAVYRGSYCYTCVYRTLETAWGCRTSKSLLNHKLNMMEQNHPVGKKSLTPF